MTAEGKDSRWPRGHRVAVAPPRAATVQGERGKQWKGKAQWKPN
jgi:hypothetical protein